MEATPTVIAYNGVAATGSWDEITGGFMTMQTDPTAYADINELLERILSRMQGILGKKLIGLYIFGSLVTGDFDHESSDIDLVAAISADLNEREFESIKVRNCLSGLRWFNVPFCGGMHGVMNK